MKQILPEAYDAESLQNVSATISSLYDANGNVVETTGARGLTSVNQYDNLNRLEKSTQVLGDGLNASENIVSEFTYDANNNQTSSTLYREDAELTTTTLYDALDRAYLTTDPENYISVVFSDLVGNKIKIFDKRANANADGTANTVPQLRYFTQVTFDRLNRMVKNTLPLIPVAERTLAGTVVEQGKNPFSTISYLKNSWVDEVKDLNGNISLTEYDAAGRKTKVTNALGQDIDYSYDKAGNILTQTVENNLASGGDQITSYTYDKRNLLLTETLNPGAADYQRITTYTYDANGNKKTRVLPNTAATTYNYDALDRLTSEVYVAAAGENRTYEYNQNGAVINCTDNTGKLTYTYDLLGRQLTEAKFDTAGTAVSVVESTYDKASNRLRSYFPGDKKTLVSTYDKRNLLTALNSYSGRVLPGTEPAQSELTTYSYDANGLQLTCSLPNSQVTTKTYDQANRLLSSTTSNGIINSYSVTYKRDAVGNQLQAIETRSSINGATAKTRTLDFIYDATYQLTKESDDVTGETIENTYNYDLQGNRLSRTKKVLNAIDEDTWTYTNDVLNRTTAVDITLADSSTSSYAYLYDANGNRSLRTYTDAAAVSSTHTYFYDQENRLVKVTDSGIDVFTASYDYRTRRTAKAEVKDGGAALTTAYIYDGNVSCQEMSLTSGTEYTGSNAILDKQYIRGNGMGGGIGSVLYMERSADLGSASQAVQDFYTNLGTNDSLVAEYYTYNAVGSVVANTDQDGYVIRENDFDAYGNIVREEDLTTNNFPIEFGGSQNDLLFSTKERDFSTGLDYFGFRYYDAVLGKFITRDPSGYPDGPNNYLYVNNNPINSIDPLGLARDNISMKELDKAATHVKQELYRQFSGNSKNASLKTLNSFWEKYKHGLREVYQKRLKLRVEYIKMDQREKNIMDMGNNPSPWADIDREEFSKQWKIHSGAYGELTKWIGGMAWGGLILQVFGTAVVAEELADFALERTLGFSVPLTPSDVAEFIAKKGLKELSPQQLKNIAASITSTGCFTEGTLVSVYDKRGNADYVEIQNLQLGDRVVTEADDLPVKIKNRSLKT